MRCLCLLLVACGEAATNERDASGAERDSGARAEDSGGSPGTDGGEIAGDGGAPIAGLTRVFYDGFEDGTIGQWSGGTCPVVETAPDGAAPRAGARMLQCNWDGTVEWNDPAATLAVVLDSWEYGDAFLLRFSIRNDTDFDHTAGAKWMRLGFGGAEEIDLGAFNENWPSAGLWFHPLGPGAFPVYWGEAEQSVVGDNEWHSIEIYSLDDTDGRDGVLRAWVDDVLIYEIADGTCFRLDRDPEPCEANTHDEGASRTPLNVMSNWSNNPGWEHDESNHVLWDEFEIFSDDKGGAPVCGGALETGDARACP
jgi:hypothetical protein